MAATVLLVRLFDEWASFLPAGTFESFRSDLGLTYGQAGLVLAAIGPGALAGSAFSVLADSRSRRVIATSGAACYAAALAVIASAQSLWMLVVGGVAIGIGATAMVDTIEVALVDIAGDALEVALARVNLAGTIGDLLGPAVVAGTAALGWSWRVALWISAGIVAGYAVLVSISPLPAPLAQHAEGHRPMRDTFVLLRRRDVWWAGACGAMLVALDESFIAFVIAFLRRQDHLSSAVATAIVTTFVVGGIVVSMHFARGTPRDGTNLRTPAVVMFGAALLLVAVPEPWLVAVTGFVLGAATIAFWIPFQAQVLRLVPGRTGSVKAVVGTLEMLGLAVPPAIGAVSDALGLHAALAVYACIPGLLTVFVWLRPRSLSSQ